MTPRLPTLVSAFVLASFLRLAAGCGGDAHYMGGPPNSGSEVSSGAASGSAVESGASGSVVSSGVGFSGTAESSGTLASSGAPGCVISASAYDQSCAVDADCTGINPGNYCGTLVCDCGGPTAAINVGALPQYDADLGNLHPVACPCPFIPANPAQGPCCRSGSCQVGVCGQDAGVASADAEAESSDAEGAGTTDIGSLRCGAWVDQTHGSGAAEQLYASVTSDASGEHLVATSGLTIPSSYTEGVWVSTNGGATWNVQTAAPAADVDMASLASSSDGSVIVGCGAATGGLCTSTNGGVTWDCSSSTSRLDGWVGVASSSAGTALVAVNAFGDIWTSSNSGATWIDRVASGSCPCQQGIAVASDASGANLVELGGIHLGGGGPAFNGDIWTSNDSGVTWTDRTPSGPAHDVPWAAVASNATGDKLIAVGSKVWLSTDSGATWTDRTPSGVNPSGSWRAVASDATGTHLVVASGFPSWTGDLWTSTDSGVTWTNETAGTCAANQAWSGVASDATGSHLVAVASGGDIWTRVSQAP